jgi:uncharacterized protein
VLKPAPRKHPKFSSDFLPQRLLPALLIAVVLWLGWAAASAQSVAIPPAPQRWMTDEAGLLSSTARAKLDAKLESYEQKTGHQIVVFIGDSIGAAPLDDFAVKTFRAWQLGKKGADDGLLVLVLARDRKIAIEVGYGLESRVPDAMASRIIQDIMAPKLRAGDADGALEAGVDAILASIEGRPFVGDPSTAPPHPEQPPLSKTKLIVFGLLALGFLALFLTNPSLALSLLYVVASGRHGHGGGRSGGWGGGGFAGGGGRSGGGGARGSW